MAIFFKKNLIFGVMVLIVSLFVSLRLFRLNEGLLFYNDMGRDYLVLLDWAKSGKPPLLGPQTSVISYNQSAWYFYVLLPLFVLTGHSPFASTYTLLLFALVMLSLAMWRLKDHRDLQWAVLVVFFLLAIQPQAIWQNRFIWNPSFVPYFLLVSYGLLLKVFRKWQAIDVVLIVFSLVMTVGFSYAAFPLAFILWLVLIIRHRRYRLMILGLSVLAGTIVLLPMLIFELRHGLVLTKLLFIGQTTPQTAISLADKSRELLKFILPTSYGISAGMVIVILMSVVGTALALVNRPKRELVLTSSVTILLIGLTMLLPVNVEKHYIFGLLVSVAFMIAFLPKKAMLPILVLFTSLWLSPNLLQPQYARAIRTVTEMKSCYQQFCANFKEPIYVSSENGILVGYHNAPEHRFLLLEAGCEVLDIEKEQSAARYMLVIGDSATFDPIHSAYRELTLFGEFQLIEQYVCTDKLNINLIQKL